MEEEWKSRRAEGKESWLWHHVIMNLPSGPRGGHVRARVAMQGISRYLAPASGRVDDERKEGDDGGRAQREGTTGTCTSAAAAVAVQIATPVPSIRPSQGLGPRPRDADAESVSPTPMPTCLQSANTTTILTLCRPSPTRAPTTHTARRPFLPYWLFERALLHESSPTTRANVRCATNHIRLSNGGEVTRVSLYQGMQMS